MPKDEGRKTYQELTDYVRNRIMDGTLGPGDRLPTERFLCEELDIGRSSVREGLKVLQNLGIIESIQGSGNFVSLNFNETLSEMLSLMYFLKGQNKKQVTEFRWMIEREALELALERMNGEQKEELQEAWKGLEAADCESDRKYFDRRLHQLIVIGSGNDFLIANYDSLISFIDRYIEDMRGSIIAALQSKNLLEDTHRMLVEGILDNEPDKARTGLENHIHYVEQYWSY